jgi:AcrR family transcriptional regulator
MADVAAMAGVSQGLAYRYFVSKDELLRTLLDEALRSERDAMSLTLSGTPGEQVVHLVSALVDGRRRQPELYQLLDHILREPTPSTDVVELVDRRRQRFLKRLRRLIVQAQARGELPADDPDQLISVITACLDGLSKIPPEHFPDTRIVLRLLSAPAIPPTGEAT